jgi:hypothetical protein
VRVLAERLLEAGERENFERLVEAFTKPSGRDDTRETADGDNEAPSAG